jgi:hypothetical protein
MNIAGKFGLIGVVTLVCVVVAMSGCTSQTSNKTYSYGTVSFLAPSDMKNATLPNAIISGSDIWTDVGTISNDKTTIRLQKASSSDATPSGVQLSSEYATKQNSGNVTSTTHGKNPNGLMVYGSTQSLVDPSTNKALTYYEMDFEGSDGMIYTMSVYGDSGDQNVLDAKNMVYDSLKA